MNTIYSFIFNYFPNSYLFAMKHNIIDFSNNFLSGDACGCSSCMVILAGLSTTFKFTTSSFVRFSLCINQILTDSCWVDLFSQLVIFSWRLYRRHALTGVDLKLSCVRDRAMWSAPVSTVRFKCAHPLFWMRITKIRKILKKIK